MFFIFQVLLAFCCLIIGFAFSFLVVFHDRDEFRNFWNSILKTMVMMMGEYEYGELFHSNRTTYNGEDEGTFLPFTGKIIFFIFIMIASIVLINLMIGLAVNDIQGLEKEVQYINYINITINQHQTLKLTLKLTFLTS